MNCLVMLCNACFDAHSGGWSFPAEGISSSSATPVLCSIIIIIIIIIGSGQQSIDRVDRIDTLFFSFSLSVFLIFLFIFLFLPLLIHQHCLDPVLAHAS